MKAEEMVGLTSSILKHFEDTYSKIKELRNVFNKQLALDTKIEKIEVIVSIVLSVISLIVFL
jgi:ferritin-like metal-binding protein YciE